MPALGASASEDDIEQTSREQRSQYHLAGSYSGCMKFVERYAFQDCDATTAAGVSMRIPTGVHQVERRSLVFRVRLGGREVDLTLAEWDRLQQAACVGPVSATATDSSGTAAVKAG